MHTFMREVRQTLAPDATSPHGPLTPLLIVMTFVTGLVDAFSYLVLGTRFRRQYDRQRGFSGVRPGRRPGLLHSRLFHGSRIVWFRGPGWWQARRAVGTPS